MDAISFLKPLRIMLGFLTLKKSIISLLPLSSFFFMSLHFMKLDAFLKFLISFKPSYLRERSWTHVVRTCHLIGQLFDTRHFVAGLPLLSMVSFTLLYVWIDLYLKKKNLLFFQWSWVLQTACVSLAMSNWM